MTIVRWEPARELTSLQSEMNRLFSSFFDAPQDAPTPGSALRRWVPAMDLVEHEDRFVLTADLPGLDADDVTIEVEDRVLTVKGERTVQHETGERGGALRIERATGAFSRSLTLPEGVDADAVGATFDKGVLTVEIPKPEERKPRRVQIAVGDRPATLEAEGA